MQRLESTHRVALVRYSLHSIFRSKHQWDFARSYDVHERNFILNRTRRPKQTLTLRDKHTPAPPLRFAPLSERKTRRIIPSAGPCAY